MFLNSAKCDLIKFTREIFFLFFFGGGIFPRGILFDWILSRGGGGILSQNLNGPLCYKMWLIRSGPKLCTFYPDQMRA